ncbi:MULTISPECIES: Gfo/Idh/MocA family protein [Paenibacillus]|uniref:Gfo/Idh/MocA family protein n=1 Tax=Paenibacillus TaxID=44249 RepID=UPI00096BDE1D|nr:Gfo/Idh/MocA family oxidoreductase [Paenibacillus odorifer]OMD70981.1 oxidoreductase [Paenibacillus odorifer]OMD75745.1 oxidoreductase [Paenibacillus odorifer]
MLKIGLIGFGFMGRMHFDNYVRLTKEGQPIALKAICDLRIEELKDGKAAGNMSTAQEVYDLSAYNLYDDLEKMIASEELDMIDIAVPTYLHAEMTCSLLERGYHVFCEKPMARTSVQALEMVETAARSGKKLMIGHCLRFWPGYEYLKEVIESGQFGQVTEGYFYRGSGAPKDWFLDETLSGGGIMDMHIHDTDMINYLFGRPDKVSSLGRNVLPGSGYDIASTHYFYKDAKVINAQVDWTLEGDFGFYMGYRVNFERGNIVFNGSEVKVNPNDGAGYLAELSPDVGYYRELVYFLDVIIQDKPSIICTPESTAESLRIVEAEMKSADAEGEWIVLD